MKENVGVLVNFKLKIMNEGAEYEKFTQEIYNEILKKNYRIQRLVPLDYEKKQVSQQFH